MPFQGGKPEVLRQVVHSPTSCLCGTAESPVKSAAVTMLSEPHLKVSDENVYSSFHIPTMSSYRPALLFLHTLALLDSCEGLRRLLAAHGTPFHLSPVC